MKVKALRYKKGLKEFVHIEDMGAGPEVFTSDLPKLQPTTATLELMCKLMDEDDFYEGLELDLDTVEFVEFELVEKDTIGADIRNKLSSSLNLIELLDEYFSVNVAHATEERMKIVEFIKKEMIQSKKSIEYLAKLL